MRIKINETYSIDLDNNRNHTVLKRKLVKNGKTTGTYREDTLAFSPDFENAFKVIRQDMLLDTKSDEMTMYDFLAHYTEVNERLLVELKGIAEAFKAASKK